MDELARSTKVVGLKQSRRAIQEGKAARVYLAADAAVNIRKEIAELCGETVELKQVPTMAELGEACGVDVATAVATILMVSKE